MVVGLEAGLRERQTDAKRMGSQFKVKFKFKNRHFGTNVRAEIGAGGLQNQDDSLVKLDDYRMEQSSSSRPCPNYVWISYMNSVFRSTIGWNNRESKNKGQIKQQNPCIQQLKINF